MNIIKQANHGLLVAAMIGDEQITVSGVPVARSDNKRAIFFDASSNNPNFEVINMEYVNNTETNMYFKNYCDELNANQILKIYLRNLSSSTREYVMIECFDYKIINFSSLVESIPAPAQDDEGASEPSG